MIEWTESSTCCFDAFDVRDGTVVREDVRDTGRTEVDLCDDVTDAFEFDRFDFNEWTEFLAMDVAESRRSGPLG